MSLARAFLMLASDEPLISQLAIESQSKTAAWDQQLFV